MRFMKKFLIFIYLALPIAVHADIPNPFFGDYEHQVALNVGAGVNSGFLIPPPSQFVPYTMFDLKYSIPATFFRMPARQSIGVVMNVGYGDKYGWDWDGYTIPIALLSMDVALVSLGDFYAGAGIGAGMQLHQNERIGSKLIFGFKLFTGYKISERWRGELFVQHFSNGNCAPENHSYGFYGLGVNYSF